MFNESEKKFLKHAVKFDLCMCGGFLAVVAVYAGIRKLVS